MTGCPTQGELVEIEIDRIATQYREANRLIGYMRAVLSEVEDAARVTCEIPEYFDILSAAGEQLTFIGKRMGFPRCHCICVPTPVLGFSCEGVDEPIQIAGACEEATWLSCHDGGAGDLCIYDDEAYRAHLLARRYQMLSLFDWASLRAAIQSVWGSPAWIVDTKPGRVVISPGRPLSPAERARLPVTLRILPAAPGVEILMWLGSRLVAGFGTGWAGACVDAQMLCPIKIDPYACN